MDNSANENKIREKEAQIKEMQKMQSAVFNDLLNMTKEPMKAQTELLFKILQDNKDTEYGRKYNFADIKTIEDFRENVPVSVYDDYESYIERMAEKGERDLITVYPMQIYNKTSGTVGIPKKIPMTKQGVQAFQKYTKDYQSGLLNNFLGVEKNMGRRISLVQAAPPKIMPDGIAFGALSDNYLLKVKPMWDRAFVTPAEAAFAEVGTNLRYIHARFALCVTDPVSINCSYTSYVSEFLRYIENNWELLVKDIENGTIDDSVEMPEDVRSSLTEKIKPMPERAAELRDIFSKGFEEPFVPKVWPKIVSFTGGASGSFRAYTEFIKKRYLGESIKIYCRGICASEGAFTAPTELESYDSVLLPDSVFFEFAEEKDGEVDLSDIKTLDKLEIGKKYELIITNLSGYYRYRMRDVFLVKGMYNNTPLVEYLYRSDKTVSIMGEKTTETALRETAENAAKACGFSLIDSTVYPDTENTRYVFLLEIENVPESLTEEKVKDEVEKALAAANPSMGDKIKKGLCRPVEVKFMQSEAFLLWRDIAVMRGASPGQQKPVTVISNEAQHKFFFSQTEDFETVKSLKGIRKV
ncbi:MAG: GH3 auxin-responsive promoter family protein [Firmicutes bacterium]|nr:GH3 auxin-responsive promoter family protein [Bacillota bacterium]